MKEPNSTEIFYLEEEKDINLKEIVFGYLNYWPWFLLTILLMVFSSYLYLRYASRIFQTSATIKILDKNAGLELPSAAFIFKRSNINLENEIEILKSYRIIEQVVENLNLATLFYREGDLKTSEVNQLPFSYVQNIPSDSIGSAQQFEIQIEKNAFNVLNVSTEEQIKISEFNSFKTKHNLPFEIVFNGSVDTTEIIGQKYIVYLLPMKTAVLKLKNKISVEPIGEQSDLLTIKLKGESPSKSELIINNLIEAFNNDGIIDRQLVSKRTLDFIDERFVFLADELDSIEVDRKEFKQKNNLVELSADAELGIEMRAKSNEEVFKIENQLALANLLLESLESENVALLPANFGLESNGINSLIENYNTLYLEREKLASAGGGKNNPSFNLIDNQLKNVMKNIDNSVLQFIKQLQSSKRQIDLRNRRIVGEVAQIPKQEKLLRAIERQQKIKESLYLLLLQKREEAAINYAITEPSIKVVEYALSGSQPISPKSRMVYALALFAGIFLPIVVIYIRDTLDTKIISVKDIEKISKNIPIVAEIPKVDKDDSQIFSKPDDRGSLAESFRILSANVQFLLTANTGGKVIYCTSSVKGEGKTFVSLNLSLALSSLNKKVLLIGADMRNPQLHSYLNIDKSTTGLSSYLHDIEADWKDFLIKGFESHDNHDILIAGVVPPNPAHLLTNNRFALLLEEAKQVYDYVIVDTAPTVLVTDTLLISSLADATLYITRSKYTESKLLEHSKDLFKTNKVKNMAYVLNGVSIGRGYGYGYNYGYAYGYGS